MTEDRMYKSLMLWPKEFRSHSPVFMGFEPSHAHWHIYPRIREWTSMAFFSQNRTLAVISEVFIITCHVIWNSQFARITNVSSTLKQHGTGECTHLLGFLLIIPITISFMEGRIPPFISPIYSPCHTIEMVTHQFKRGRSQWWILSCTLPPAAPTRTKAFIDAHLKNQWLSSANRAFFCNSRPLPSKKIRFDPQWGWFSSKMLNYIHLNVVVDTYMLVLVRFFHSTQGVMQVSSRVPSRRVIDSSPSWQTPPARRCHRDRIPIS